MNPTRTLGRRPAEKCCGETASGVCRAGKNWHHRMPMCTTCFPRSMGGTDEMSNLVTLCDGCHASHHPNLAGGLARRALERWAVRLARWLDRSGALVEASGNFGPALRLFGVAALQERPAFDRVGSVVRQIGARGQPDRIRQDTMFPTSGSAAPRRVAGRVPAQDIDVRAGLRPSEEEDSRNLHQ